MTISEDPVSHDGYDFAGKTTPAQNEDAASQPFPQIGKLCQQDDGVQLVWGCVVTT